MADAALPAHDDPLQPLIDAAEATVQAALRHAAGELDADGFARACADLAQAFAAAQPQLRQSAADAPPAQWEALRQRLQTLHELQARLQAQARAALAGLLPNDTLQDYARLGRSARPGRRPPYA
ncbi:MAG: hypothetical protein N2256_00210 [Tepidimonas ignava]|nr:hypothetical protein [Tepidimonas ignava]